MSYVSHVLQSEHILALLVAVLIFFTTILLVVKRWIGFSMTLLLLIFSLAAGLIINHHQDFQHYLTPSSKSTHYESSSEDFHKQMLQAVEDLKMEVAAEKENLRRVMDQVQDIFTSMDAQKQKLQHFIGEVRQHFNSEHLLPSDKLDQAEDEQHE